MPIYYNEDDDKNRRRQNDNPNYGTNANFRNYREPNRATSDTEASSTANHIGDLYRRHRMNQAEAQNDAGQIGSKIPANNKLAIKATMCSTE
jgi:hypothetical protein